MSFDWSPQPPQWSRDELDLLPVTTAPPPAVTLTSLLDKSASFPCKFPIETNRCATLKTSVGRDTLERNINSAYPIVHENVLHLYARYILHKRQHGSSVEKLLYRDMTLVEFTDRLLTKRAVTFMGRRDSYLLLDGKKGSSRWESVGTSAEREPLVLAKCLSYEEVKLSAFLSVSSFTYFVNRGERKNMGVPRVPRGDVEDEGVVVGVIGPRLVKTGVMEYQELVVSPAQNTKGNGYGHVTPRTTHHVFAEFYQEKCPEYGDVVANKHSNPQRYTGLKDGEILDNLLYYKRMLFTVDPLLLEANRRALDGRTTAYVHVVGVGLGVWKRSPCQNGLFMEAFGRRLLRLGPRLGHVSDVCFAHIQHDSCLGYRHGDTLPTGVKVHICKREPHAKLTGADSGKLLVVSYAWDGNAMPGNEFWKGQLGSSGDSAAASSTQIAELHNPFVNVKVCGDNLRVVAGGGVVDLGEYVEAIRKGGGKRPLESEDEAGVKSKEL